MKNTILYTFFFFSCLIPVIVNAQEHCMHSSAGNLTPVGVMGGHTHSKGSWMFSYQFMQMNMEESLSGSEVIGQEAILEQYMMAPAGMQMQMHMLMGMYSVTDRFTLMAMLPYLNNQMQMTDRMGMSSEMHSSHIGDVSISGLYSILKGHRHSLVASLGIGIPTGSIRESSTMSHMNHQSNVCLPYMMQTGSGTIDLLPSLTYQGLYNSFAYGLQANARLRTANNIKAYRLGHVGSVNAWLSYQQNNWLSYSARVQALQNGQLRGKDADINPMMAPTGDVRNTGGEQLNTFLGASFTIKKGVFQGHRFALEYGIPLYQNLNGIQMQGKSTLLAGWQFAL